MLCVAAPMVAPMAIPRETPIVITIALHLQILFTYFVSTSAPYCTVAVKRLVWGRVPRLRRCDREGRVLAHVPSVRRFVASRVRPKGLTYPCVAPTALRRYYVDGCFRISAKACRRAASAGVFAVVALVSREDAICASFACLLWLRCELS